MVYNFNISEQLGHRNCSATKYICISMTWVFFIGLKCYIKLHQCIFEISQESPVKFLHSVKGLFKLNSPCQLLPPLKFSIVPMVMAWLTGRILSVILITIVVIKRHGLKDVTCEQMFNWTFFSSWRSSVCCRSTTALDRWSSCCSRSWVVTRLSRSLTLNPSSSWRPYRITRLAIANIVYLSTFTAPCQSKSLLPNP